MLYPWHFDFFTQFTTAYHKGFAHHAHLFKTAKGIGCDDLIMNIAKFLLCHNKKSDNFCDHCKSCMLFNAGNHNDFTIVKSIDAKDISVDMVRTLNESVYTFASQGGAKVIYIKDSDKLNEASSNALLKILEEPAQEVYFLLKTPQNKPLIATIASRCQNHLINPPTEQSAIEYLRKIKPNVSYESYRKAIILSQNQVLNALPYLDESILQKRLDFLRDFWRFYTQKNALILLKSFGKETDEILQNLHYLETFLLDALKLQMGIHKNLINEDLIKGLTLFVEQNSSESIIKSLSLLQQTRLDITQINGVNVELMLVDFLVKMIADIL